MKKVKEPYHYLLTKVLEFTVIDCKNLNKTHDLERYLELMEFINSPWLLEICEVLGVEKKYPYIKETFLSLIKVKKEDCRVLDRRKKYGILSLSERNSRKNKRFK